MLSAFNTKFKALKSRLPQSSLDSPWRMAFFSMVATVVILAGFLLVIAWEVLKAIIHTDDGSDDVPAEDTRPDAYGYEPDNILLYTEPGTLMNPILAEMHQKSDDYGGIHNDDW